MSEARETRSAPLGLRITPSLRAALEKAAAEDHRPLSSFVEKILIEYLKDKGYLRGARK
jgi:hypothetical protein